MLVLLSNVFIIISLYLPPDCRVKLAYRLFVEVLGLFLQTPHLLSTTAKLSTGLAVAEKVHIWSKAEKTSALTRPLT